MSSSAGEEQSSARELWKRDDDADGMTKARQALRVSKPSSFDVAASKLQIIVVAGKVSNYGIATQFARRKQPFSVTNLWARFAQQRWKKVVKSSKVDGRYVYLILGESRSGLTLPHIPDLKNGHAAAFASRERVQKRKPSRCAATTLRELRHENILNPAAQQGRQA